MGQVYINYWKRSTPQDILNIFLYLLQYCSLLLLLLELEGILYLISSILGNMSSNSQLKSHMFYIEGLIECRSLFFGLNSSRLNIGCTCQMRILYNKGH
jgi:hypothetical protein